MHTKASQHGRRMGTGSGRRAGSTDKTTWSTWVHMNTYTLVCHPGPTGALGGWAFGGGVVVGRLSMGAAPGEARGGRVEKVGVTLLPWRQVVGMVSVGARHLGRIGCGGAQHGDEGGRRIGSMEGRGACGGQGPAQRRGEAVGGWDGKGRGRRGTVERG